MSLTLLLLFAMCALLGCYIALQLARMVLGKGPNHWRHLLRVDLAALLVLMTGIAAALAVVRGYEPLSAACLLTIALPAAVAFAWLGRYVIEDLAATRRRGPHAVREEKLDWTPPGAENSPPPPPEERLDAAADAATTEALSSDPHSPPPTS